MHSLGSGFVSVCDPGHLPSAVVRALTRHPIDAMPNVYKMLWELFEGRRGRSSTEFDPAISAMITTSLRN